MMMGLNRRYIFTLTTLAISGLTLLVMSCSGPSRAPAGGDAILGLTINENAMMSESQRNHAIQICYSLRSARSEVMATHFEENLNLSRGEQTCQNQRYEFYPDSEAKLLMKEGGNIELQTLSQKPGIGNEGEGFFLEKILTDRSDFIMGELCSHALRESSVPKVYSLGPELKAEVHFERSDQDDVIAVYLASRSYTSRGSTAYSIFAYYRYKLHRGEGDSYPSGFNYRVDYVNLCPGEDRNLPIEQQKTGMRRQIIAPLF